MLSTQILVLRLKNCRVNSRKNYTDPAASFSYWTARGDFRHPLAVCDHACSTFLVRVQLSGVRSFCQQSVCGPSQDGTWITRIRLVGVAVASAIKKATSGHMPHVVNTDHDTHSAGQRLQPMRNVKPVSHCVKVHDVNLVQLLGSRRRQ